MSGFLPAINDKLREFIGSQKMFFVATADSDGRINLSPKGMDTLRIVKDNRLIWLNLTGSGNETAAHLIANNRITIMFCAFEGKPLILRIYGSGTIVHPSDETWDDLMPLFPKIGGGRQIFDIAIESVQTSCGFAVPYYDYKGQRDLLTKWTENKGDEGIKSYWKERNQLSIDGKPTDL
ncbi:MAG: pyridoxamine 5'-phosphate oxidase family protein [Cyclobacteriaceae bacterium]